MELVKHNKWTTNGLMQINVIGLMNNSQNYMISKWNWTKLLIHFLFSKSVFKMEHSRIRIWKNMFFSRISIETVSTTSINVSPNDKQSFTLNWWWWSRKVVSSTCTYWGKLVVLRVPPLQWIFITWLYIHWKVPFHLNPSILKYFHLISWRPPQFLSPSSQMLFLSLSPSLRDALGIPCRPSFCCE